MRSLRRVPAMLCLAFVLAVSASGAARQTAKPPARKAINPTDATARIVAAAQALVSTLDEAGRAKVQFPFAGPQKTRWSNLPTGIFERHLAFLGAPSTTAPWMLQFGGHHLAINLTVSPAAL